VGNFRDPQASAIGHAEGCLVLDARRSLEQRRDLFDAQDQPQLGRNVDDDKPQGHLRPLEGDTEQETQCRHGLIDRRGTNGAFMLIQLEAPEIFEGGGIGG